MEKYLDIYLDVFILENTVMNYLILWVTSKFSKSGASSLRLLLGALVGTVYAVLMIFVPEIGIPAFKIYYTAIAKILLSMLMIAVAFTPDKLKSFLRILVIFYVLSFTFAGTMFASAFFFSNSGFVRNGIVFLFKGDWMLVFYSTIMILIIISVFWNIIQTRLNTEKLLVSLQIIFENQRIGLRALLDTGNSLHDPISNAPVIVVEFNAIKSILPTEIQKIFEESKEDDLVLISRIVSDSNWASRFRLIPFTSLGKENGMLIGFKPDGIEVGEEEDKKEISNVVVGIYSKKLSRDQNYRAILSPEIVSESQ